MESTIISAAPTVMSGHCFNIMHSKFHASAALSAHRSGPCASIKTKQNKNKKHLLHQKACSSSLVQQRGGVCSLEGKALLHSLRQNGVTLRAAVGLQPSVPNRLLSTAHHFCRNTVLRPGSILAIAVPRAMGMGLQQG